MSQAKIQELWTKIAGWEQEEQGSAGMTLQKSEELKANITAATTEIAQLEAAEQEEIETAIEQEHEIRVTGATSQFDDYLNTPAFGGMTFREVIGDENVYQLASIGLKKVFSSQAETSSKLLKDQTASHISQIKASQDREDQLKRQNDILQNKYSLIVTELEETKVTLGQERLERANAEQSRDNAVSQMEESKKEVLRLNGHIDDLRNEMAIGASGAINVVNTEEEKRKEEELAKEIVKSRTIYNVEWVDVIRQNRYKAKYAATGESLEFPWTEKTKYRIIDESEVSQFRSQYAITIDPEVPDMVEASIQSSVETVEAPIFSTSTPTDVQGVSNPMAESTPSDIGTSGEAPVTRSELEQRLARHKAEIIAEIQGAA